MSKRNFATMNPPPSENLGEMVPKDAVRVEFARRLQRRMLEKGWHQAELARQATKFLPEGQEFGRYNVSYYLRGKVLPGPVHLTALCKALGCEPLDLVPQKGLPQATTTVPPLDLRDMNDGNVWLRVNQAVTWPQALEIMRILKQELEKI